MIYAVYHEGPGEWRLCVLEPGIADEQLLIRNLGDSEHEIIDSQDLISLMSYDSQGATRVYPFAEVTALDESMVHPRYAYAANVKLPPLDVELQSGYDMARRRLEYLRNEHLTVTTLRGAAIFSALSARLGNGLCERSFYEMWPYIQSGEIIDMPHQEVVDLIPPQKPGRESFVRLTIPSLWRWCEEIEPVINSGLRDRPLRRTLALEVGVARGLGLAKLSFFLEILGNDVGCLDSHMLAVMAGSVKEGNRVASSFTGRRKPRGWTSEFLPMSEAALKRYEKWERKLCAGNPYYDPRDEMKIARCQWMSWEHIRRESTEHDSVLATLEAHMMGEEEVPELAGKLVGLKAHAKFIWRTRGSSWRKKSSGA